MAILGSSFTWVLLVLIAKVGEGPRGPRATKRTDFLLVIGVSSQPDFLVRIELVQKRSIFMEGDGGVGAPSYCTKRRVAPCRQPLYKINIRSLEW
jgi:hypothetical protein